MDSASYQYIEKIKIASTNARRQLSYLSSLSTEVFPHSKLEFAGAKCERSLPIANPLYIL